MPPNGSQPTIARAYWAVTRRRPRLNPVAEGFVDGLFLGLMDRRARTAVDELFYAQATEPVDGAARHYGDAEHIRGGLHDWELDAIREHFPPRGRVVITAAGAGREVLGLLDLGFDAVGYEPNAALVAAGRRVLPPERLVQCERDVFPAEATAADALIIGWGSYMLIARSEERTAFLRRGRGILPREAPMLVSFFPRPPTRYFNVAHRVSGVIRRLRRREPLEFGDALSPNFVHYFSRAEIERELAASGFAGDVFRSHPYGHVVARAR